MRPYLPHNKKDDSAEADDAVVPLLVAETDGAEDNARQCRICLADDDVDDLIAPCACTGSVRWVHRACLNEWRAQELRARSMEVCELCHFHYLTERRPVSRAKLRLQLLVVRDLCILCAVLQLVVLLFAVVVYGLDRRGVVVAKAGAVHPLLAYCSVSAVLLLAVIGFVGLCIACHEAPPSSPLCLCDPWCAPSATDCIFSACEAGEAGALFAGVLVMVALFLAVVGLCFSLLFAPVVVTHVVRRHLTLTARRDEAQHVVVVDLARRPDLLAQARASLGSSACAV